MASLLSFCHPGGGGGESNEYLLQVLRVSCNRQWLEAAGFEFSSDEALLLSYMAVIPDPAVINLPQAEALKALFTAHGGGAQMIDNMMRAVARLGGLTMPDSAAESSGRLRMELYFYLLRTRMDNPLALSDINIETGHLDRGVVSSGQINILLAIRKLTSSVIMLNKGHGWPILLAELRLVIPAVTLQKLREGSYPAQPWPYAEMMVSISGDTHLLDQLEPLMPQSESPYVQWLGNHIRSHGLPLYPGTLRAGFMTSNARDHLRRELARRPTEQQVNHIHSHYPGVLSRV